MKQWFYDDGDLTYYDTDNDKDYYIELQALLEESIATGESTSNSAGTSHSSMGEKSMSAFNVGHVFETGNEVVNTLPVGSTLEVSGDGELTIVSVPVVEETYNPGDFFASKYGDATIVGMTSQFAKVKSIVSGEAKGFLYVADGTNIVRGQLL